MWPVRVRLKPPRAILFQFPSSFSGAAQNVNECGVGTPERINEGVNGGMHFYGGSLAENFFNCSRKKMTVDAVEMGRGRRGEEDEEEAMLVKVVTYFLCPVSLLFIYLKHNCTHNLYCK